MLTARGAAALACSTRGKKQSEVHGARECHCCSMQGAGTILQDLPWSSWQESRMQNALVPNRCLIPGAVPPLNSPFVHECCLFVCRAGRCTGLGTRGFEMHPRCEGKALETGSCCALPSTGRAVGSFGECYRAHWSTAGRLGEAETSRLG